jgi:hypothetical protein
MTTWGDGTPQRPVPGTEPRSGDFPGRNAEREAEAG